MRNTTHYLLEKYLKDRKKQDEDKPARAPSGFMKKQLEEKRGRTPDSSKRTSVTR